MKTNWLITTAAIAVLASTGLAGAQGMNDRGGDKSPGAAMEKSSPAPKSQMQGAEPRRGGAQQKSQTTGQAPQADSPAAPRQRQGDQMERQKQPSGAAQQKQDRQKSGTAGQAPDTQKQQRTGAEQKQERQQRTGAEQKERKQERQQRTGAEQKQRNGAAQKQKQETTGRGDAKGATLTTEQRTKIRSVVVSKNIPRVTNVNFSISVGARVPRTVRFHPIPVEIVEIYPAWRSYRVILVSDELIIVDPNTFEIVAVVAV